MKTSINCVHRIKASVCTLFFFRNTYWLDTEVSVPCMLKMWFKSFNLPLSVNVNGRSKCWSCCQTSVFLLSAVPDNEIKAKLSLIKVICRKAMIKI